MLAASVAVTLILRPASTTAPACTIAAVPGGVAGMAASIAANWLLVGAAPLTEVLAEAAALCTRLPLLLFPALLPPRLPSPPLPATKLVAVPGWLLA